MQSYKYVARDRDGGPIEGVLEGSSRQEILTWLHDKDCVPVAVEEAPVALERAAGGGRRLRIRSQDMAALCWQLDTMIEGGVPITEALETIVADLENRQLRATLLDVARDMKRGEGFAESMGRHPKVFDSVFVSMVQSGERSGTLSTVLQRLAAYYDQRDLLARKVKRALAYPIFVIGFVIVILIVMMTFIIIPRFISIFDTIKGQLPAFTRGFMSVYHGVTENVLLILGGSVIAAVALVAYGTTERGREHYSRLVLRIPLVSRIVRYAFISTFCRSMATLLAAGVSVLESLGLLEGMTKNVVVRRTIATIRERITQGTGIAASLGGNGIFPRLVVKMAQVGEDSGSLPAVLDRTSTYYERKVDSTISTMVGLLEPALIVTVGAIVLVVLLALYLPIFSLSDIKN